MRPATEDILAHPEQHALDAHRRIAGFSYGVSNALGKLHGISADDAHETGEIGAWMALAAAEMDFLVDSGDVSAAMFRQHMNPALIEAALQPGAAIQDTPCVPEQLYLRRCLDLAFSKLRERMYRPSPGAFRNDINREIVLCVRAMVSGQLESPDLRLSQTTDLDAVERTLRQVNALTIWLVSYVGLLHRPRPPAAALLGLRRTASALGEIGWILDAMSDIDEDLEAGVWSLVSLELARETGTDATWLGEFESCHANRSPKASAKRATLIELDARGVIARLLARLSRLVDSISTDNALPEEPRTELAHLCRWMVWAFLAPASPEKA